MKNLILLIYLFSLSNSYLFAQNIVQVIEKTETNKDLFDRNSPTSLFSILEYNTIFIHPMDSESVELIKSYTDLNSDYYFLSDGFDSPIKTKKGLDSLIYDPVTGITLPIYPKRDKLISIVDSLTHLIFVFDTTIISKKDVTILTLDKIYFARKIKECEKLICTGWVSFKEISTLDKINCITIEQSTDKEILLKAISLKENVSNKLYEWELKMKAHFDSIYNSNDPENEFYIEDNEVYSLYMNHISPDFWMVNWLNYYESPHYLNRYNIPFDFNKEYDKMKKGLNHIYCLVSNDYPVINEYGEDSVVFDINLGTFYVVYLPSDTAVIWADYPTEKIHIRYSLQFEKKSNLTFQYKIEEFYFIGKIENKNECIYNFNYEFLSSHPLFKEIELPQFNNSIFYQFNKSNSEIPDWWNDIEQQIKQSKKTYNLLKKNERKKFLKTIKLPI